MDLLKGVHLKCYGFSHYRFGAKSVKLLRDKLDVYRSGAAHKIYERISGYLRQLLAVRTLLGAARELRDRAHAAREGLRADPWP